MGPLAAAAWLRAAESRRLLDALTADGSPARFVGGCVRDTLLDPSLDRVDLDVATPEPPDRVTALCRRAGLKVIPTGLQHGTVTVHSGERGYEVTTLRRDVATDGRHAVVEFTQDFTLDAARRDFTINAMSCDGEGRLFDPFEGLADLRAGRVRFVGEARARIGEDYLRILRFFRFYARFGRPPPDAEALAACAELSAGLERLSGERVRQELLRLLVAPRAAAALELMRATGVLARILAPAPAGFAAVERLDADGLLRLALLLRASGADARGLAERLRLSLCQRDRLVALTTLPLPDPHAEPIAHRHAFYRDGPALHLDLLRLRLALDGGAADLAAVERLAEGWSRPVLPLTGDDLLVRGVRPGPELGRLLGTVRAWWEGLDFVPDRAACLARLEGLLAEAEAAPRS